MTRAFSIALMFLYGLTLSQAYMPHINYWMNRDYIAAELCENKDRPELECNGKCHLKKEIESQSEDQNEGQEVSTRLMVEFFEPESVFELRNFVVNGSTLHFPKATGVALCGYLSSVFHPPKK